MADTTTVAVRLSDEELQRLDQIAESTRWSRSEVIRYLILNARVTPPRISVNVEAIDEDERRWDELFADPRSEAVLARLAAEAKAEYERGETEPLDPEQIR